MVEIFSKKEVKKSDLLGVLKKVLLSKYELPPPLRGLLDDFVSEDSNAVYQKLWYFDSMKPGKIRKMNLREMGETLAKLDPEQQDYLAQQIGPKYEDQFWKLADKYEEDY